MANRNIGKKNKEKQQTPAAAGFSLDKFIPEKYQTIALFLVILVVFLIYFSPLYFGGKTYQSGDIVTSKSLSSFVDTDREGYTLWFPYIFGGMPAYALATGYKWFNVIWVGISSVRAVFTAFFEVDYAKWTFYLFILALNMFFLVKYLTRSRLIGLFGGLTTAFSSGIILFLFIGHVTKLTALAWFPLILLMLLHFRERVKLRDFALLIIAVQLSFQGWHVQIIFYQLFAIGIYYLYNLVRTLNAKAKPETMQYLKSAGVFAGAFVIALLIQADNFTQIYEYNPYSTRGTESIVDKQQEKSPEKSDSEYYQYHTNWSFSPGEVMTFIIPSYYGFGNSTYEGPLTQNRPVEVNTYFGPMNFVDMAMYMGAVVFFLGLFSLYANRKNHFVQYLGILVIVSILISFGRNFPPLFDLMFYYFPYFSKFRVPSMILILVQLSFPILAAMGLKRIVDMRGDKDFSLENILKYAAFVFTGLTVIGLLFMGSLQEWMAARMSDYASTLPQQMSRQFAALSGYVGEMFAGDFVFVFLFTAVAFWLAFIYVKGKLSADLMIIGIIILASVDLMRIDNRGSKFQDVQDVESLFRTPPYVQAIKGQEDEAPFRILNMKQDGSMGSFTRNSNFNAYFLLQDFYGYSSIKPRAYQDYMDVVGPVNNTEWRMLNVKYIVTDRETNIEGLRMVNRGENWLIYENENVLPRAYFVDNVANAEAFDILQKVKNNSFDPKNTAFVYPDVNLDTEAPDSSAYVKITDYKNEKITMEVNATGNNLLFLGDTYYPKGWHAYIDEEETEIYRVNHGFRGIVVPEGKHTVVFEYLPTSFTISKYLALVLSTLTIFALVIGVYNDRKKGTAGI